MTLTENVNDSGVAHGPAEPTEPISAYVARQAHNADPAFTFLDYSTDRNGIEHTLRWSELYAKVQSVAAALRTVTEPGQRVAILAPQDLNYVTGFLGALHAGLIAVPLFAPEVSMHQHRLTGALTDSAPEVWLTSTSATEGVRALADDQPVPQPKQIIAVDSLPAADDGPPPAEVDLDEPAYLQYTSGSTRNPAGAVITHRAVVTNCWQAAQAYALDETVTQTGWIPFFHDMGLIQLLCVPVFTGAHSVFTTPMSFIRRPVRWLKQLGGYPNAMSAAPNFAYELAAGKVSEADLAELDLSGVHVLINGSEPVRASTVSQFAKTFAPCGFRPEAHRPSYGLAEATVFVTSTRASGPVVTRIERGALADGRLVPAAEDAEQAGELVSAGAPIGQRVRVVDPQTRIAKADGEVGEIWVNGPNVADGYWRSPERSAESFDAELCEPGDAPARGWLRTGDLGVFHDGELYITGRIKDLIIIDGKNHYPQDIENTAQNAHPSIRRDHVAAFSVTVGEDERVVLMAEIAKNAESGDTEEISRAVRKAVNGQHEIKLKDLVLLPAGSVLRTSSGKIARAANKKRYLAEQSAASAGA